jgi:hypothetical protein
MKGNHTGKTYAATKHTYSATRGVIRGPGAMLYENESGDKATGLHKDTDLHKDTATGNLGYMDWGKGYMEFELGIW